MNEDQPGLLEGAIPPERNTVLYGHDSAQAFLANAYRSGRMHHAILIEGADTACLVVPHQDLSHLVIDINLFGLLGVGRCSGSRSRVG